MERVSITIDADTIAKGDLSSIIEPVWWTAHIYGTLAIYEASLKSFSHSQRIIFALQWYQAEVDNGGHDQFYFNSTGIVWPDALAGFDAIGVPEGATIIRESAKRL